jgi:hypothetical protein
LNQAQPYLLSIEHVRNPENAPPLFNLAWIEAESGGAFVQPDAMGQP